MPRGRPKGSTGNYFRWSPEKIADLWQDAEILANGKINRQLVARLLREKLPGKYGHVTEDHLRQQLSRDYQQRKRKPKLDDLNRFNADLLAHLLGETK